MMYTNTKQEWVTVHGQIKEFDEECNKLARDGWYPFYPAQSHTMHLPISNNTILIQIQQWSRNIPKP